MHIPYRLFRKPPRPMNDATPPAAAHDPLSRQEDGEPRFVLLGRDPLAADFVFLWVAARKRDAKLVDAISTRIKEKMLALPYQPHKDAEHIQSGHEVANKMFEWHLLRSHGRIA